MLNPEKPILMVDDEEGFLRSARLALLAEGYDHVACISQSGEVLDRIARTPPCLVTLDLTMPGTDGYTLLRAIVEKFPGTPIVVLTGIMEIETAIACMKAGARDYLMKPLNPERLVALVQTQLAQDAILEETVRLKKMLLQGQASRTDAFSAMHSQAPSMQRIFAYAEAICKSRLPVLITGETGTGKELMARALHQLRHPEAPFVALNVAGLDEALLSDSLFGHVKGAFTGAHGERRGLVEKANGGTLFLDEIGDLSPESQVKLLRLLQEGEFYPVGSDQPRRVQVWVLAATHKNLADHSQFRKDLYYRLQSHSIELPPLRERPGDLALLIRLFSEQAAEQMGRTLSEDFAMRLFKAVQNHPFPGNVRELQGLVEDMVGTATPEGHPQEAAMRRWLHGIPPLPAPAHPAPLANLHLGSPLPTLEAMEDLLIAEALTQTRDNRTLAAAMLGITRQTLLNKLKRQKNGTLETPP
jgi:DNA-binding NtrC family response regulator